LDDERWTIALERFFYQAINSASRDSGRLLAAETSSRRRKRKIGA
jgi:hypothetical protein